MNGLSLPLDIHQILTWGLTALPIISFFCIQFPLQVGDERVFWSILFILQYSIAVFLFVITTLTKHYLPESIGTGHTRYCRYCKKYVPSTAKHCGHCNVCRVGFDHHCLYVNNCVTSSNYYYFYFGLLFFISAIIINIIQTSIVVNDFRLGNEEIYMERLAKHLKVKITRTTAIVLFVVNYICNFSFMLPISVLVGFHVYFQAKGITTYDFIIKNFNPSKQTLQMFLCNDKKSVKVSHS